MNSHEEFELLSAYLDDEAPEDERARVEAHVAGCAECRATLDALRATVADLVAVPEPEPTAEESWALRARLASARKRQDRTGRRMVALAGVAAGIVAIAGVTIGVFDKKGGEPAPDGASISALAGRPQTEIDERDFDESSVDSLLGDKGSDSTGLSAGPAGAAEYSTRAVDQGSADPLRCEQEIAEDAKDPFVAQRYVVATWKDEPAFFLVYHVEASPPRLELWVVAQDDCGLLFFRQRPA